ncbi:MAG: hypothetical protein KAU01_03140 [Candidatus Cloacimonetes bacterium]|nr:hypothetical protein [Candidatus Cloacimonadota bacterium]
MKILTLIFSIIALFISIKSCQVADNALQVSNESMFFDNRPYVTIVPSPFKSSKKYLMVSMSKDGLKLETQLAIKNVGKAHAHNLKMEDGNISIRFWDDQGHYIINSLEIDRSLLPDITLGPGQIYDAYIVVIVRLKSKKAISIVNELQNGTKPMSINLSMLYTCEIGSKSYSFKTMNEYRIYRDHVELVSSFMN